MAIEKKSKSLSKATKTLSSGGETEYVDFKRTSDGVHADDLVSFANSDHGGEILVGIAEETGEEGSQRGVVIGCDISDGAVLQIFNKAFMAGALQRIDDIHMPSLYQNTLSLEAEGVHLGMLGF